MTAAITVRGTRPDNVPWAILGAALDIEGLPATTQPGERIGPLEATDARGDVWEVPVALVHEAGPDGSHEACAVGRFWRKGAETPELVFADGPLIVPSLSICPNLIHWPEGHPDE